MRKIFLCIGLVMMILLLSSSVLAVVARIGGAIMRLNAEVGDTVERSVLVRNINNVSVNITILPSGDLLDKLTLDTTSFILAPQEYRDVNFKIQPTQPGKFQTSLNVRFTPVGEKNGAGLTSNIYLNVYGVGELEEDDSEINNTEIDSGITGNVIGISSTTKTIIAISIIPTILGIIFLIFLFSRLKNRKKRKDRSS